MENILNFDKFNTINEDGDGGGVAVATASTTTGMGAVVAAQPSSTPGAVVTGDGTTGSGDIGVPLFNTTNKDGSVTVGKRRDKKKDVKSNIDIKDFMARFKDDKKNRQPIKKFTDYISNDIENI